MSGERLYGDDFEAEDLAAWFADERDAYADLGAGDREQYFYAYHALNRRHGLAHLPSGRFEQVLGLGSAYGDEFAPIAGRIGALTIVDPGENFRCETVHGIPTRYVAPDVSGTLPFEDGRFDLITCLGALHHIANAGAVVRELARCLSADGVALIHEPIVSMGDWRKPRKGLTRRERGIPLAIYRRLLAEAGFEVQRERLCLFQPIARLYLAFGRCAYDSRFATFLDEIVCRALAGNVSYHRTTLLERCSPTCVYSLLTRRAEAPAA